MAERLFLFNSAYRGLYRENMLRTCMLPNGWINKYRYSDNNTDLELTKKLANEEINVTIVYIDRFYEENGKKSYRYYPIRNGKLKCYSREMSRNAFYVELNDFVSVNDLESFNSKIAQKFDMLPKLTNNNPESLNDGIYTILDKSDNLIKNIEPDPQLAWINNVKLISKTHAFSTKLGTGEDVIFLRFDVLKNENPADIISNKKRARYKLTRGSNYKLEVSYFYPIQYADSNAQRTLQILPSGHIKIEGTNKIRLNSSIENKTIYFKVDQSIKDTQNSIDFEYDNPDKIVVVAPYETIEVKTIIGMKNWVTFSLLLFGFTLTSIIINLDFSSTIVISFDWIVDQIFSFRFLAHLIQGAIILFMLKFIGEKVY